MNHVAGKYVPQGFTAAQLNLSYCVATLLIDGEVFVEQFTEEKLTTARAWRWRTKSASCTIRRSPRAAREYAVAEFPHLPGPRSACDARSRIF